MIEFYILIYKNIFCAEYQIKTIYKFCKDPFKIIFLDSNCGSDENLSNELNKLCKSNNIDLLILPNNLDNINGDKGSLMLGTKLNYVFNTIIKKRKPPYFAFLDQDMFLFKPFTIIPFLDKYGMWGDVAEVDNQKSPSLNINDVNNSPWILHPWLSFFKYDFVKDENMDWRPCEFNKGHFDTGGFLWEKFISKKKINKKNYWFRDSIHMIFPFEQISNAGPGIYKKHYFHYKNNVCYGQIQINNEFIHMLNSPSDLLHPKVCYVKGFLDSAIIQHE